MRTSIALHAPVSFAARKPSSSVIGSIRRIVRRWFSHCRLNALTAALADLQFNPYQYQVDTGTCHPGRLH